MKIGSILCAGGNGRKEYRRNIYLTKGRMYCEGNDITPQNQDYRYAHTAAGRQQAEADIYAMYGGEFWGLEVVGE
mgnify:CR=1 FL=1